MGTFPPSLILRIFMFLCLLLLLLDSSYRSPVSVDMDEMMAAMVLTSLSCSPLVQSPSQAEPGEPITH